MTELEVIETIAAIIPTMTIANGLPFDCIHYKGNMEPGNLGNNGSLLQDEGVVQIAIEVGDGSNSANRTQTLTKTIPIRLQAYYRIPSDFDIKVLGWEYQKVKSKIKNMITQRFRDPNIDGIDPLNCQIEQLEYTSDGWLDGFDKQDKYGLATWYAFEVTYSTAEDDYDV